MRRKFLWGGDDTKSKIHWVSWSKVVAAKSDGGLGVGTLKAQNIALLTKWWWKIKSGEQCLWKRCIISIHNLNTRPVTVIAKKSAIGTWCNIAKAIQSLPAFNINYHEMFTMIPASNTSFLFWKDRWCGTFTLQENFPRLYDFEKKKLCTINERITPDGFNWCWKVQHLENDANNDFTQLCSMINNVNTLPVVNGFRFNWTTDDNYTVCSLRQLIDSKINSPQTGVMIKWSKTVPLKIRCFIWRSLLDRLPVAANLEIRGVQLQSVNCPLCNIEKETGDHLFINCSVAKEAREWILKWCGITATQFYTVKDFVNFAANWGSCPKQKERMNAITYGLLWFIWVARNNAVFNHTRATPAKIADEVISQTYTWFKYRTKDVIARWIDWSIYPFC